MKMCEYLNNLLSLNTLNNQARLEQIKGVKFKKDEVLIYANVSIFFEWIRDSYLFFRVEKEVHEPIYKILGRHIENEEFVDEYIRKYGAIPMKLDIKSDYSTGIELIEIFDAHPYPKSEYVYLPKYVYLYGD